MAWKDNPIIRNYEGTAYTVQETAEGLPYAVVPTSVDPDNAYDFDEVAAYWAALPDGDPNKKQAGEVPGPPDPTPSERVASYEQQVYSRLDSFVRERNYPDATTCATYMHSTNMQKYLEAKTLISFRDTTMNIWFTLKVGYEADAATVPATWAEVAAQLPVLAWPPDWLPVDGNIRAKLAVDEQTSQDTDNKIITGSDGLAFVA